ncbi:hypothetical protein RJ640_013454, partial [Escallonia rubra]
MSNPVADSRSNRAAVQATNDDASASKLYVLHSQLHEHRCFLLVESINPFLSLAKRSCVRKGYMKDDYIHLFVRRPVRRSPIINRGYFARWAALRKLLFQFLNSEIHNSEKGYTKKQILSLGAGFDTTYFQLQDEGKAPHLYVELDFKEVTCKKAALIESCAQLREKVGEIAIISPDKGQVLGDHYKLLPVDLRDIQKLDDMISLAELDPSSSALLEASIVIIASAIITIEAVVITSAFPFNRKPSTSSLEAATVINALSSKPAIKLSLSHLPPSPYLAAACASFAEPQLKGTKCWLDLAPLIQVGSLDQGCVAAGPEKVRAIRECPKPSYKARSFYGLPTFIIAECVLIYLDPDSSRAIVAWASKTFSTGIFFLYEQ